jgi:hypothetical protein
MIDPTGFGFKAVDSDESQFESLASQHLYLLRARVQKSDLLFFNTILTWRFILVKNGTQIPSEIQRWGHGSVDKARSFCVVFDK